MIWKLNKLPLITLLMLIIACRKTDQDAPPPTPTGPVTAQEINNWILDSMRYFYLWSQYLPSKADSQPAAVPFFNGLKYSADRFSLIYDPRDLSTYPTSLLYTYGIDFSVIDWAQAPGGVIGVIKLVMPGTPAAQLGLQRGHYFTRINGTILNSNNAAALGNKLLQAASGSFTLAHVTNGQVREDSTVTINAQILGEDPVYLHSSFTLGGKKVAYIFYNYCNDSYNPTLISIFQHFKNTGVTELILDLRYNPGGSVTAAALLAALIAPNINEQRVFARYSGNARLGQRSISFKSALSVPESGQPIAFSTLEPARLSLQRVFILAGPQTASAAELVVNNLKPYTQVVSIGQNTFGKDKGAVIISDLRTPQRIPWVLLPVTYNLSNANGEGGYTQGLSIQYQVNEMSVQPLSPPGDHADPLIAKAISIINSNGRQTAPVREHNAKIYFDSGEEAATKHIVRMPAALLR